jgi:hypothetical protein
MWCAGEMSGIIKRLPAGFYVGQEVIGSSGEAVQVSQTHACCCYLHTCVTARDCVCVRLCAAFDVLHHRTSV